MKELHLAIPAEITREKLDQVANAVYQKMDQLYQGKMYFPGYFPNELRAIFREQVHLIQNAIIESEHRKGPGVGGGGPREYFRSPLEVGGPGVGWSGRVCPAPSANGRKGSSQRQGPFHPVGSNKASRMSPTPPCHLPWPVPGGPGEYCRCPPTAVCSIPG
uniref:Uncharacterized protein n=1 Tax=Ursus americanus TaxID=9643 RepID=A0A452SR95_URSAM